MSLGVGLPMMKLKPGKCGTRSGMGVREACLEAGSERASKTETLDKSKSGENYRIAIGRKRDDGKYPVEYVDVPSGKEMYDFFETSARDYSERRKREGKKALRKDAPIAATFIIKPEMEKVGDWSEKDVRKFALQSLGAWTGVWGHPPDYVIVHMDEGGPHIHIFDRMLDANGDYRMSKVVTRSKLCEWHSKYVEHMNEQGFDVDAHDGLNEDGSPRTHSGQSAKEHAKQEAFNKKQAAERAEFEEQKAELEKQKKQVERDRMRWLAETQVLEARRQDVSEREFAIKDKERDSLRRVDDAKRALNRRESRLDERERVLAGRERTVEQREQAVTERERAVKDVENEREQQMEQVKREVEAYKTEQMGHARSRASEYEARRKAEADARVKVEVGRKVEAIDAELDGYRARKRAAIEDEADKQVKRLSEPIDEQVRNVVGNRPFDFVADVLDEAARRLDEEGLKFTTGEPFSGLLKDAAEWCRTLSAVALDENEMGDKVLDVRRGLRTWAGTYFKRMIEANIARPVSIDVPSPVSVTAPPPAEVYGVDDQKDDDWYSF